MSTDGRETAPDFRSVCQHTGDVAGRPPKLFTALSEADAFCAERTELETMRRAFAAAVGFYSCPCGSAFEFSAGSTLEDYAALNRWLGQHTPCAAVTLRSSAVAHHIEELDRCEHCDQVEKRLAEALRGVS